MRSWLWHREVDELEDVRQLVHRLRHKNIEHRHGHKSVDEGAPRCAAEAVPLTPAAHPDRVAAKRRIPPRTTGRALAGEEGASVAVARSSSPRAPPPWSWWLWSVPAGAVRVVLHCGQDRADGLLFVPEHRTQPPLSPSPSDATHCRPLDPSIKSNAQQSVHD